MGKSVSSPPTWPCRHLKFELQASRTVIEWISGIFSHPFVVLCDTGRRELVLPVVGTAFPLPHQTSLSSSVVPRALRPVSLLRISPFCLPDPHCPGLEPCH